MPTTVQLTTEIQSGPHAATLAPMVAAENDIAIADFLNDRNGTGSAVITLDSIPRQRVMRVFLRVAIDLDTKTAAMKSKWDRILPFIRDMEDTPVAVINDVLDLAVADGLLTAAKVNNIRTRSGSRAEVLWGEGVFITPTEVSKAVRLDNGTGRW